MLGSLEVIVKMVFAIFLYFLLEFLMLLWKFLKCQAYFSV